MDVFSFTGVRVSCERAVTALLQAKIPYEQGFFFIGPILRDTQVSSFPEGSEGLMKSDAKLPDEAGPPPPAMVPKESAEDYFVAADTDGDDVGLNLSAIRMEKVKKKGSSWTRKLLGVCAVTKPYGQNHLVGTVRTVTV